MARRIVYRCWIQFLSVHHKTCFLNVSRATFTDVLRDLSTLLFSMFREGVAQCGKIKSNSCMK